MTDLMLDEVETDFRPRVANDLMERDSEGVKREGRLRQKFRRSGSTRCEAGSNSGCARKCW